MESQQRSLEFLTCPICKRDKSVTDYYVRRGRVRRDGSPSYQHGCKECRKNGTVNWQAQHPDRTRQLARKSSISYYARNREAIQKRNKDAYAADPETWRAKWRARYATRKAKLDAAKLLEGEVA